MSICLTKEENERELKYPDLDLMQRESKKAAGKKTRMHQQRDYLSEAITNGKKSSSQVNVVHTSPGRLSSQCHDGDVSSSHILTFITHTLIDDTSLES